MYYWLWIIIFASSVVLEFVTAGNLVCIWFAIGAIFGLIAHLLGLDFIWQVTIFFTGSLLCILMIRPLTKQYLRGNIIATNADRFIGQHTPLTKEITSDHWGEVNMHGVIWNAIERDGHNLKAGTLVEVIAIEGSKLIVREVI